MCPDVPGRVFFRTGACSAPLPLSGRHALLDDDLLPASPGAAVPGETSGSVGQPVGRHVLLVGLADDLEGAGVGVGDVGDGVAVERGLVGHRAHLLDGGAGRGAVGEHRVEGLVVAERDVCAGAQPPRGLLGGGGGGEGWGCF